MKKWLVHSDTVIPEDQKTKTKSKTSVKLPRNLSDAFRFHPNLTVATTIISRSQHEIGMQVAAEANRSAQNYDRLDLDWWNDDSNGRRHGGVSPWSKTWNRAKYFKLRAQGHHRLIAAPGRQGAARAILLISTSTPKQKKQKTSASDRNQDQNKARCI